jgi:transposase
MNIHQNARLMPSGWGRLVRLVRSELRTKAVAETMGVSPKTVGKWVARFETERAAGLQDRSSRPY